MKRKRYDVSGMMEWHPEFKVGMTHVRVSFTGGHLCGGGRTPASFETDDPVVQAVIEGTEAFRTGRIRVGMEFALPVKFLYKDAWRVKSRVIGMDCLGAACPEESRCVFEYRTIDDISDFLQFQKGVSLERLHTEASIFEQAKLLGLELRKKD